MEYDMSTTTIYEGDMLQVWQDMVSVYLRFDSCIVILPVACWPKIKNDFRKISNEIPPSGDTGTICGRRF